MQQPMNLLFISVILSLYFSRGGCKERKTYRKYSPSQRHAYDVELAAMSDEDFQFINDRDEFAKENLKVFQNNGRSLTYISIPPGVSLFFCPLTLYLYKPIARAFWSIDEFPSPPNINDSIGCFLIPAGMVHAITFGFAFEEVYQKHAEIDKRVHMETSLNRKLLALIRCLKDSDPLCTFRILHILKTEVTNRILILQDMANLVIPGMCDNYSCFY